MDEAGYRFKVIGYMRSPFLYKNGTPRQPGICRQVRGEITIDKKIFNNPEHSLEGLEEFSHVWIFFIFHKNSNAHFKAKVKPPRLNGSKTGVFSTRSPYRPNNIGLTLAKIECVKGDTVTVSGIDILDGTPVLDLKPYIPQYDNPSLQTTDSYQNQSDIGHETENQSDIGHETENQSDIGYETENQPDIGHETENQSADSSSCTNWSKTEVHKSDNFKEVEENLESNCDQILQSISISTNENCKHHDKSLYEFKSDHTAVEYCDNLEQRDRNIGCTFQNSSSSKGFSAVSAVKVQPEVHVKEQNYNSKQTDSCTLPESVNEIGSNTSAECSSTADWIAKSPVSQLTVRFTPSAEEQLKLFSAEDTDTDFKLQFLKSYTQAKEAIVNILHEDPRSTYRRNHCQDALYYFTLDVLHVTCWFDEDFVEIVRVKPLSKVGKLKQKSQV